MSKLKPPCMTVVQYVLPALRVLILKELMEEYNMRKIDAAAMMKLTPAAITQYAKGERGATLVTEIIKSEETLRILSDLSKAIAEDTISEEEMMKKLCKACRTLRYKGICTCPVQ
jgi:predicted transcriptional regulator